MGMEKFRVGLIGLGGRGMSHLAGVLLEREDVTVTCVCDVYEDRRAAACKMVEERGGAAPAQTDDYRRLIESPDVDVVVIASSWENHIPAAVHAMECGKAVASEVGGAYTVEDCWKLVDTREKTGRDCMFLENCCYDRNELMVLRMVREGLFGKIVHCEGGYQHDLREEVSGGARNRHYRLRNYQNRCAENYPTHELGPIAKILDINRGNRMLSLCSMASGAWGLNEYARLHPEKSEPGFTDYPFRQGDIVKTLIRCAHGETICLTLDTTLPRYYSRNFTVRGTKGFFGETEQMVWLDSEPGSEWDHASFNNLDKYRPTWEHPIWRRFFEEGVHGGHGGMDWLVFDAFFTAVREGQPYPIDAYDMASWMAITPLSEQSIACGGAPVAIPDFTRGAWLAPRPAFRGFYELD